jgi:hypothetical protein
LEDLRSETGGPPQGTQTRGPRDDFYCWKFQIWYPSEDCIHRHANRTYPACADCFQGRMNLRYVEKGHKPPLVGAPGADLIEESA